MITRYTASFGTASLMTLGLLILMSQLIATGRPALGGDPKAHWISFVVADNGIDPVETRRDRPDRQISDRRPHLERSGQAGTGEQRLVIANPTPPAVDRFTPVRRYGPTDGDLQPLVKVQPNYPQTALTRGIEGYVIVEFDVTRAGNVANVHIVESSNSLFERAAAEATLRFRYKPRVVAGEPVRVTGVRHLLRFELEDQARH